MEPTPTAITILYFLFFSSGKLEIINEDITNSKNNPMTTIVKIDSKWKNIKRNPTSGIRNIIPKTYDVSNLRLILPG
jgi:hypothetical protein